MSVGLFIILALVVLILLVCVGYCVYKNCCAKKNNPGSSQQYSGVPTKPSTVP